MTPSFLTSFDDTLPVLPGFSPAPATVNNPALQLPGTPLSSASSTSNSSPSSGSGNTIQSGSGGLTSFLGTRGIAIVLGFLFIGGGILLFLGDDIAGAVQIATEATA